MPAKKQKRLARSFLTDAGKRGVAASMYAKGTSFIGAAILVRGQSASEHSDYVVLHLLCQGLEVLMKGLLLHKDYDRYRARLGAHDLGHNILDVTEEALREYGLNPMRDNLKTELRELDKLYRDHWLRYGSTLDILVDPRTIQRDRVLHRLRAAIRLASRLPCSQVSVIR
jgi:hypothetical protein